MCTSRDVYLCMYLFVQVYDLICIDRCLSISVYTNKEKTTTNKQKTKKKNTHEYKSASTFLPFYCLLFSLFFFRHFDLRQHGAP